MENTSIRKYIETSQKSIGEKFGIFPELRVEENLIEAQQHCKKMIDVHLDDFFQLYDVGISVIIEIHNICKNKLSSSKSGFVYSCITAKIVTQLLSIRTLLNSGMLDTVKCLVRPFHEAMDILFACMGNNEFLAEYGNTNDMYDNNQFWKDNIGRGKIKSHISKLFKLLDVPEEYRTYYFDGRKGSLRFLSESVHSSFNSIFSSFIMSTIDGKCSDNIYGKVTTAYPNLMFSLLEDINLINQIFFRYVNENKGDHFRREDFIGSEHIRYHEFFILYDTAYSIYHLKLKDLGDTITSALKKAKEEAMKYEASKD